MLTVQHPEFAPVDQSVKVALDRPAFVMIALDRGAALSGTVKTASGAPVPFARIELKRDPSIFRLTGAEGSYSFEHLAAGETKVSRIGGLLFLGAPQWRRLYQLQRQLRWEVPLRG